MASIGQLVRVAVAATAAIHTIAAPVAWACSCADCVYPSLEAAAEDWPIVFRGRVQSVPRSACGCGCEPGRGSSDSSWTETIDLDFLVVEAAAGVADGQIVTVAVDVGTCPWEPVLEVGDVVDVVSTRPPHIDWCSPWIDEGSEVAACDW